MAIKENLKKAGEFALEKALPIGVAGALLLGSVGLLKGCREAQAVNNPPGTEVNDRDPQNPGRPSTPENLPFLSWNGDMLYDSDRGFGIGPRALELQGNRALIDSATFTYGSDIAEYLFIPMFLDRFPLALTERDFTERLGFAVDSRQFLDRRNGVAQELSVGN